MSSLISENSLNIIVIDFLKLHVYEIFVRFPENLLYVKSPIPVIGLYLYEFQWKEWSLQKPCLEQDI